METELIRAICVLAAIGAAIPSLEFLVSWFAVRAWFPRLPANHEISIGAPAENSMLAENMWLYGVMICRLTVSIALVACVLLRFTLVAPLFAASCLSILSIKMRRVALDGADQMTTITFCALTLGSLSASHSAQTITLMYLAGQALLSYLAAGTAKLVSKKWLFEGALGSILNNYTYGHPLLSTLLLARPKLDKALSVSVAVTEVLLPVLVVLPGSFGIMIALVLGLSFHVGCAIAMGLNNFVFAFAATYPAIYYLHWILYN